MSSLPPQRGCPSAWGGHSDPGLQVLAQQQIQLRNKVCPEVLLGLDLLPDLERWQQSGLPHPLGPVSQRQWLLQYQWSLWTWLVQLVPIYSPQRKQKNRFEVEKVPKASGRRGQLL